MSYDLNIQEEEGLLRVDVAGDRTQGNLVDNAIAACKVAVQACNERGLSRILVISSATGEYPALDAYEINSKLQECGVQRGWKIAFVNLDLDSFPDMQFAETVAVNWGFFGRVFNNEEDARMWLSG